MLAYIFAYLFLVFFCFSNNKKLNLFSTIAIFSFFVLFIGLRYEVGPDWNVYVEHFQYQASEFFKTNPGYGLMFLISNYLGFGIVLLNLISAVIFISGLLFFCKNLKNSYLGLVSAYPYLIVVVSMGFITQACSIGLEMIALVFYERRKYILYYLLIGIASLFHNSALLLILIPLMDNLTRFKNKKSLALIIFFFGVFIFFYLNYFQNLFLEYEYFFTAGYNASGAIFKIVLTSIFAIIFVAKQKMFGFNKQQTNLGYSLSLNIFLILGYTFLTASTAATYRISLYFLPLVIMVSSALPYSRILRISVRDWKFTLILINLLLLIGWFSLSYHSQYWIPYNNVLFL